MARKSSSKKPQKDAPFAELNDWALTEMLAGCPKKTLSRLRVRDRISLLVQNYLGPLGDYKPAVRRELCGLRPWNLRENAGELYRVVDEMWTAAGDTSTDYNFYTKRGILAGVLASTMLRWLADTSDDHEATWSFLDNRIENVMQFEKVKSRLKERFAA